MLLCGIIPLTICIKSLSTSTANIEKRFEALNPMFCCSPPSSFCSLCGGHSPACLTICAPWHVRNSTASEQSEQYQKRRQNHLVMAGVIVIACGTPCTPSLCWIQEKYTHWLAANGWPVCCRNPFCYMIHIDSSWHLCLCAYRVNDCDRQCIGPAAAGAVNPPFLEIPMVRQFRKSVASALPK